MTINDSAIAGIILLAIGGVAMTYCSPAKSQEHHMHGSKQADADEVTYNAATRQYFWRSKLSGKLHVIHEDNISTVDYKPKIRVSQDGRLHGCERNTADKPGSPASWVAYCLYLPPLM